MVVMLLEKIRCLISKTDFLFRGWLIVGLLVSSTAYSQRLIQALINTDEHNLIQDSLYLDLQIPEIKAQKPVVGGVEDCRKVPDSPLVAIDEVKEYGLIPVDQMIYLHQPLDQMAAQLFRTDSSNYQYSPYLRIRHFELEKSTRFLFWNQYSLHALVGVDIPEKAKGELMYAENHTRFFIGGGSLKKGYERVIAFWLRRFPEDVASVQRSFKNESPLPYHYRPYHASNPWMQLRTGTNFIITTQGYVIDAQMHFVYPEVNKSFGGGAKVLRYRHGKRSESIEWGIVNGDMYYRLNRDWISNCRFNLFMGINRWKNMKRVDHKLYDAVISDLSILQSIHYHPRNTRTFTWGLGLYQSIHYVYSEKFNFEAGLTLHVGMQI